MIKDNSQKEKRLCPKCLAETEPHIDFCQKCGVPLGDYANYDPLKRIQSTGWLYRHSVSGPSSAIILCGIWLIFGPTFLLALVYIKLLGLAALFLAIPFMLISSIILYRATKNYIRNREKNRIEI
jgi:hypothetical protein